MRKFSLIVAVLLFAAPAWATVHITCSCDGDVVTVSYTVDSEPNKVRAFALDITVGSGTITAVDDSVSSWYTIYPGSIVIEDGVVTDDGNAVADPCDHPDTQGGVGTGGITVEMGALYSPPTDPCGPPLSGDLLTFTVSETPTTVTITENDARGGVVMTDPTVDPDVNAPGCECGGAVDCLIGGNAGPLEYSDWANPMWGKPACWCYCRQCRGDTDGTKTGPFYVAIPDLTLFAAAYGKMDPQLVLIPNGICADLDHKKTGPFRVAIPDLTIFSAYYGKMVAPKCDAAPIITGPYNFWCNPTTCAPPGVPCP